MLGFNKTIQSLAQRNQNNSENIYAITAYEKTGELTADQLQTRIKSHLLTSLRSHSKLASLAKTHDKLVEYTLKLLNQLNQPRKGLVLFLQFNAPKLEKETRELSELDDSILNAKIISLYKKPSTHIYVGKIFDFTPLFRLIRKTPIAVVVQVENQAAKIYSLTGTDFELKEELENWHNQPTDKEYREVHHTGGNGQIHQSSGTENVARRQINANKAFLGDLVEPINKLANKSKQRQLAIYASKNYQPFIEKWANDSFTPKLPYSPLVTYKIFKEKDQFLQDVSEKLDQHQKEIIKSVFNNDQEDYQHFAKGWQDVTDAVRESRVERLYITKPSKKRVGFILDQSFPYSYPIKNTKRVKNLLPWLTQGVIATGGEVITGKVLDKISKAPIAAKLRYTN